MLLCTGRRPSGPGITRRCRRHPPRLRLLDPRSRSSARVTPRVGSSAAFGPLRLVRAVTGPLVPATTCARGGRARAPKKLDLRVHFCLHTLPAAEAQDPVILWERSA
ncbi:hypothetical protein CP973_22030 [Streptomyces albofaciens JCM 4342]|nr:hypothetical protein CP973_22030 [Streptomyces albofaciens JCM 4342]